MQVLAHHLARLAIDEEPVAEPEVGQRVRGWVSSVITGKDPDAVEIARAKQAMTERLDRATRAATLASVRGTAANADSLMLRLSSNTTQLQAILARLERGEGTAGKFMTDSMLYRDARNLLTRVDSLVSDFQRNPRKYINLRVF